MCHSVIIAHDGRDSTGADEGELAAEWREAMAFLAFLSASRGRGKRPHDKKNVYPLLLLTQRPGGGRAEGAGPKQIKSAIEIPLSEKSWSRLRRLGPLPT
jgi:hypothetical protein